MALRYENEANEIVGYDENGVKLACVQFPAVNSDTVDVEHTEVDPSLQGQGVAVSSWSSSQSVSGTRRRRRY